MWKASWPILGGPRPDVGDAVATVDAARSHLFPVSSMGQSFEFFTRLVYSLYWWVSSKDLVLMENTERGKLHSQ